MTTTGHYEDIMTRTSFENNYTYRIRLVVLGTVCVVVVLFFAFPRFRSDRKATTTTAFAEFVEEIQIPETHQFEPPPSPSRPSIPVESEMEDFAEDITIEETILEEYTAWEVPPMPDDDAGRRIRFIPYEEPPHPIGGYAAITSKLEYPPIAREAGIEGNIVLQIFVNKKGFVEDVVVVQGLPQTGMDEAATRAIKQVRFKPAKQRDQPIGVWIAIPIRFKLRAGDMID